MAETSFVKKYKAARRAQIRLKQTFERIDFEEDVLKDEVATLLKTLSEGKLPEIAVESATE